MDVEEYDGDGGYTGEYDDNGEDTGEYTGVEGDGV